MSRKRSYDDMLASDLALAESLAHPVDERVVVDTAHVNEMEIEEKKYHDWERDQQVSPVDRYLPDTVFGDLGHQLDRYIEGYLDIMLLEEEVVDRRILVNSIHWDRVSDIQNGLLRNEMTPLDYRNYMEREEFEWNFLLDMSDVMGFRQWDAHMTDYVRDLYLDREEENEYEEV